MKLSECHTNLPEVYRLPGVAATNTWLVFGVLVFAFVAAMVVGINWLLELCRAAVGNPDGRSSLPHSAAIDTTEFPRTPF